MPFIDPVPADGTSALEVTIVRNLRGILSETADVKTSVPINVLLAYHTQNQQNRVEGYYNERIFHRYVRAFVEPFAQEADFQFTGQPFGRICALQEYVGAKARIKDQSYILQGTDILMIRKSFANQTALWRDMEGWKRGTARWKYSSDFSEITIFGEERSISNPLPLNEAYRIASPWKGN